MNVLPASIYLNCNLLFYCTANALHSKLKNTQYKVFSTNFYRMPMMCLILVGLI